MKQLRKFRPKYFFIGILAAAFFCTLTWKTAAYAAPVIEFYTPLTAVADTIKPLINPDSTNRIIKSPNDTTIFPHKDSSALRQKVDTFSLKLSKDSLEAPLKYTAEDSVVVLVQDKKILLYGNLFNFSFGSYNRAGNTNFFS